MKRLANLTGLLLVLALGVAPWAAADRPHGVGASPEITSIEWLDEPVVGEEALLEIWSVDEHGVISEIMIDWGDNSFDFAHTNCLQGDEQGLPHRMVLGHVYEQPGEYTITIVAVSRPTCRARGGSRESEEVLVDVVVMP